jgi:hypothetical protein
MLTRSLPNIYAEIVQHHEISKVGSNPLGSMRAGRRE